MSRDCHDPLSLSPLHLSTSPFSSRLRARDFWHLGLSGLHSVACHCCAGSFSLRVPLSSIDLPRSLQISYGLSTTARAPGELSTICTPQEANYDKLASRLEVGASFAVAGFGSPRRFASGPSLRDCSVAHLAACTMLTTLVTCSSRLSSPDNVRDIVSVSNPPVQVPSTVCTDKANGSPTSLA